MRTAGRVLAWIVLVVAGLATLLFIAVAIDNDGDSDLVFGGLMFAAIAIVVGLVAFFVQRALRRRREARQGETGGSNRELLERAARGETVRLQPRRLKWVLVFLGCLLFSVFLVPAAFLAPSAITIAGALLFGPGAILAAWSLVPGAAYLRISPEGLEAKVPVRTRRWAWNDIERFRVFEVRARYSTQRFVGFDMRELTHENQSFFQTVNRGVSGVDAGLPDTYGVDPEELADALNRLRERHATEHGPSPSQLADRQLEAEVAKIDTGPVIVTWVLALACVGVYAWEASRYDLAPSAAQLVELGGATSGAAWWTLLFGNLLHADLLHIGLNLFAWAVVGFLLEREIGPPRMALLVVVAGVASMGLAVLLQPGAVTVGFSGVVIAAAGWGMVRDLHRTRTLGVVAWSMLPFVLVYTFLSPGTSIGGHLGGLAAGLLLGWYTSRR